VPEDKPLDVEIIKKRYDQFPGIYDVIKYFIYYIACSCKFLYFVLNLHFSNYRNTVRVVKKRR
jgi:hypothetical protein